VPPLLKFQLEKLTSKNLFAILKIKARFFNKTGLPTSIRESRKPKKIRFFKSTLIIPALFDIEKFMAVFIMKTFQRFCRFIVFVPLLEKSLDKQGFFVAFTSCFYGGFKEELWGKFLGGFC
jgi:hypothetical protein